MITWPDLVFPPINLYTAPYYENRRCMGQCDRTGRYCRCCHRMNFDFGEYNAEKETEKSNNVCAHRHR